MPDSSRRVPIVPRGWIDESALELFQDAGTVGTSRDWSAQDWWSSKDRSTDVSSATATPATQAIENNWEGSDWWDSSQTSRWWEGSDWGSTRWDGATSWTDIDRKYGSEIAGQPDETAAAQSVDGGSEPRTAESWTAAESDVRWEGNTKADNLEEANGKANESFKELDAKSVDPRETTGQQEHVPNGSGGMVREEVGDDDATPSTAETSVNRSDQMCLIGKLRGAIFAARAIESSNKLVQDQVEIQQPCLEESLHIPLPPPQQASRSAAARALERFQAHGQSQAPPENSGTRSQCSPQSAVVGARDGLSPELTMTPPHMLTGADAKCSEGAEWTTHTAESCQWMYSDAPEIVAERSKAAERIRLTVSGVLRQLNYSEGVALFGSFTTGFKSSSSDLDMVYAGSIDNNDVISLLAKLSHELPKYGFDNITKVFQSSIPLVKFTDVRSGMEIDFCMGNELGVRNSLLLNAYCQYDQRVVQVGRAVKQWAKRHELVGTADGCLNSYAYMLMTIHYLQSMQVVPNFQVLATLNASVPVVDRKWGTEDTWETKFEEDWQSLAPSKSQTSPEELIVGFFRFFTTMFDWRSHAVCIRLNKPGSAVDKYTLATTTTDEQWYVEDPFDLKHNLAGRCSLAGRERILTEMRKAFQILYTTSDWQQVCPPGQPAAYYLKCRVSPAATPELLIKEFREFSLLRLFMCVGQAYLEFPSSDLRRRAHSRNESYVADCQLHLHYCTRHSVEEAAGQGQGRLQTYEVAETSEAVGDTGGEAVGDAGAELRKDQSEDTDTDTIPAVAIYQ